jgi:hypothetical protein
MNINLSKLRSSMENLDRGINRGNGARATQKFSDSTVTTEEEMKQARYKVEKRLEKIEKGVLGGEMVKGISQRALMLARQAPTAYLDILARVSGWEQFTKAFDVVPSVISGLQAYDLEKPAKLLYPVVCPIRNKIPRVNGIGMATNWRTVLSVDDNNIGIGVATGARGGVISQRTASLTLPYRTIGLENFVTFEAQSSSQGYEDVLALAVLQTMQALMIREEQMLIAGIGNPSEIVGSNFTLGTCPTPSLTTATTGGALAATTQYYIWAVAMSLDGLTRVLPLTAASLATTIARGNADGSTTTFNAGFSQVSASNNITTGAGSTNSITATVAAQVNAWGYIWFINTSNTFTTSKAWGVTNQNVAVITNTGGSNFAGPTDLSTNDRSANVFVPDGLWTQALGLLAAYFNPSSITGNSYYSGSSTMINQTSPYFSGNYVSLNGGALTSNGATGASQIDAFLQWAFDLYKFSPEDMWVSSDVAQALNNLCVQNGGSPIYRLTTAESDNSGRASLSANVRVTQYINPITGTKLNFTTHPYLTRGVCLFSTDSLPYELSNVGPLAVVRAKRDYYAQEWPLVTRKYQYGVYSEEAVECYAPFAFQAITNIGSAASTGFSPSVTMPTQSLPANYV